MNIRFGWYIFDPSDNNFTGSGFHENQDPEQVTPFRSPPSIEGYHSDDIIVVSAHEADLWYAEQKAKELVNKWVTDRAAEKEADKPTQ